MPNRPSAVSVLVAPLIRCVWSASQPACGIRRVSLMLAVALFLLTFGFGSARATLIITAICQDGVVIRSDKRNTIKRKSKPTEYKDDLKKVFATADKSIIIYNHGINRINRIAWDKHAATLATKLQEAKVGDLKAAMDLVETTLAEAMSAELARNKHDDFSAFVVVMKTADGRYRAGEISWKKDHPVGKKALGNLILSGSGKKYCILTTVQKSDAHWAKLNLEQTKSEIGELFAEASKRQAETKGKSFSEQSEELSVQRSNLDLPE
jgi:hypothetical protein